MQSMFCMRIYFKLFFNTSTEKYLSFKDALHHCREHNMTLAQEGIDTTAQRQFVKQ